MRARSIFFFAEILLMRNVKKQIHVNITSFNFGIFEGEF